MIHEIALTIKPTMRCNMRCKHCFNGTKIDEKEMLNVDSVYNFIESACREYKDIKITFHGGEPTLAGYSFYAKIYTFEKKMSEQYGVTFSNNFTTNGLLLTDNLIDLLISNNTLINISFDGPYNNILRSNTEMIYQKILKVKSKNGRLRVFCTISRNSCSHLLEIYKWFNTQQIDFKILPIEPRGNTLSNQQLLLDIDKFIYELSKTYRYWAKDQNCNIRFYTFEEFALLDRTKQFKPFWFNREIALNPNGNIYPFGRPNDIQFCLGVSKPGMYLSECFKTDKYNEMIETLKKYRQNYCSTCSVKNICNGVCICMSYMYVQENKLLEYSCNQSRQIFESILNINDEIQNNIKSGNIYEYNYFIRKIYEKSCE